MNSPPYIRIGQFTQLCDDLGLAYEHRDKNNNTLKVAPYKYTTMIVVRVKGQLLRCDFFTNNYFCIVYYGDSICGFKIGRIEQIGKMMIDLNEA
jgi:hypothetical protein